MDKVIIIDGIDVSECEHFGIDSMELCKINFDNNYFSNGIPCAEKCSNHSDCYYKQLKRLRHYQAEFEHELMNDYTYDGYISPNGFTPIDVIKHIKSELKRLQAENEKLKKQYNCYACDSCGGKEDYINMKRHIENAIKTVHKYSQAIQEIRDIVSEPCIVDENCQTCNSGCMQKDILTKINKVIGAEE